MYTLTKYSEYFILTTMAVATSGLYNAARFKPAVQSSDGVPYYAYLGVDGNYDANAFHGHCQHTFADWNPWWMVDLRGQFVIEVIQLTNRYTLI